MGDTQYPRTMAALHARMDELDATYGPHRSLLSDDYLAGWVETVPLTVIDRFVTLHAIGIQVLRAQEDTL